MNVYALSHALICYRRSEIEIATYVLAAARGGEGTSPLPHEEVLREALIYFSNSKWLRLLTAGDEVANAFHRSLELLLYQGDVLHGTRAALIDAYLAMRRYMHFAVRGITDYTAIKRWVEKEGELPFPFPEPFQRTRPLAVGTIENFLRDLQRLLDREPIVATEGIVSGEYQEPAFEQFSDARWGRFTTVQWSCHDVLRPLLPRLLQAAEALSYGGQGTLEEVRFAALDSLVIYTGLDYRDGLNFSVGPATGLAPGCIDLERGLLTRYFRNGYFRGGAMFRAGEIKFPLPPSIMRLLERSVLEARGSLSSLWGPDFRGRYAARLRGLIAEWQPRMRFRTLALHHSFHAAALFECNLLPAELSLLLGYAVYGSRTPCKYISASDETIQKWWCQIHGQLRAWGGLSAKILPKLESTGCLYGKGVPTHVEWLEKIRRHIAAARNWNELVVCMEALSQSLGGRNRVHVNPLARFREVPCPHLLFHDKDGLSEPIGLRQIPAVPEIMELVRLAHRIFGDSELLTYFVDGQWCSSDAVRDQSLFEWLSMAEVDSIGRTAYINGLRSYGAGGACVAWLSGHQNKDVFHSMLLPVPVGRLMAGAAEVLAALLQGSKFVEAVRELGAGFDRMPRPSSTPMHLVGRGDFSNLQMERLAPPSRVESAYFQRLLEGVFQSGRPLALHSWASGILLALEVGVPFARLIADRPQLTFRALALDEVTQNWFFIPVLEQEDVGHLSPYVFRLPAQSLSVLHVRRRFRLLQSGQSKDIEQFLNSQLLGSRQALYSQVQKIVCQLLSRPGDRVVLPARVAIRLIDRLSCQLSSHYQPGSVAASLRGALPFGINHVAVEQVIEAMTGCAPRLIDLAGQPWHPWVPASHRRTTKAPIATYSEVKKRVTKHRTQFAAAVRNSPVKSIVRLFVANRLSPARARFRDLLSIAGIEERKAEAVSRSIYARLRALGNLALTKPVRMSSPEAISELVMHIANEAAVSLRYFWRSTRAERIRLRERAAQHLMLCAFTGDRVGETTALLPGEVCTGPFGNYIYVYDGKTKSARRAVHVEYIGASPALSLSPMVDNCLVQKERSVAMRLRRLLAKFMPLSLHDLRRSQARIALGRALEKVYPTGNLVEFLATLARQFGHCSLITFLHSYVGGMLAALAVPSIDWQQVRWSFSEKNLRNRIPDLLRIYDGTSHAIDQLRAAVNRTRALDRVDGLEIPRCWIGEYRYRTEHLRWCDARSGAPVWPQPLPDRPDLAEFWSSISKMRDIASARGISLLFIVKAKTRDRHRHRFVSMLGSDCFAGESLRLP